MRGRQRQVGEGAMALTGAQEDTRASWHGYARRPGDSDRDRLGLVLATGAVRAREVLEVLEPTREVQRLVVGLTLHRRFPFPQRGGPPRTA